jgi:hypothetical protein
MARKKKLTRQDAINNALYLGLAKFGGASPKLMAFRAFMESLNYLDDEDDA